jgi:hypothetical protein
MINIIDIQKSILILVWIIAWFSGGYLILLNGFKFRHYEGSVLGFGIGLFLQVWVANWMGQVINPVFSFWLSAMVILIIGIVLTLISKNWKSTINQISFSLKYWIPFVVILVIFFMIGRGLAIFDDYQNLPVTSYIASGAIPPNFVLNPTISFDYHYLMLLNAAQWMRIADLFPWTALDLTRAIFFGLTIIYTAILSRRITFNWISGWIAALFVAFAGGLRWVLLFLPDRLLNIVSNNINMIGSGLGTADNLKTALISNWAVEGAGPIPFPFAFGNGYHTISVMEHDGTGLMGTVLALIIILLFQKWRNAQGKIVVSLLISTMALIDEIWFVFFIIAAFLLYFFMFLGKHKLPRKIIYENLLLFIIIPILFSIVQGGVLTGVFRGILTKILGGTADISNQYYSINFPLRWPPAFISAHLGELFLTKWTHLLVAFFEVGPVIFLFPLFLIWGWKSYKNNHHIYSILSIASIISLLMVFVQYQGSAGVSATKRLTLFATDLLIIFTIPIIWRSLKYKKVVFTSVVTLVIFVTMIGGIVNFGIESIATREPVLSYFIDPIDAVVQEKYWDTLKKDAMVFDWNPSRSATIFARPLESNINWYKQTDEFTELLINPDPFSINSKGYQYVYWTKSSWEDLSPSDRELFQHLCVEDEFKIENDSGDFRWLLDISACQK